MTLHPNSFKNTKFPKIKGALDDSVRITKENWKNMAIHKSAKKRIRRNGRKAVENKSRLSETRTYVRKVEEAIKSGDQKAAQAALKTAQPHLHRTAAKNLIHKKNASRKLSRLSARIKLLKK